MRGCICVCVCVLRLCGGDQAESGSSTLHLQSNNEITLSNNESSRGCLHLDQVLTQVPTIVFQCSSTFWEVTLAWPFLYAWLLAIPWLGEMILQWRVAATRQAISRCQGVVWAHAHVPVRTYCVYVLVCGYV